MLKIVILAVFIGLIFSLELHMLRPINNHEFILSINEKSQTWNAGINERFENMSLTDAKILLGALETPENRKLPFENTEILNDLPENFDLRTQYPQCKSLKEVRDQSGCGSCWAFGAAEAMSDRICIASKGESQIKISTEHIISCCYDCGMGCNGGYPDEAWQFWKEYGVPTGGLYNETDTCKPYSFPPCDHHIDGEYGPCGKNKTPKCTKTCQPNYKKNTFDQDLWYAKKVYKVKKDENTIMSEIYTNGSVEVSFTVYEDFLNYKSGVYQHVRGNMLGGHAVKMIGWGVQDGVKYWIIVNSWNKNWGDEGTFKILRGSNHCGIESGVVAGTPIINQKRKNIH